MKQKMFPTIKRLTGIFTIAIVAITVVILTLRLTAFSDKVADNPDIVPAANGESSQEETQTGDIKYTINSIIYFSTPESEGTLEIVNPANSEYDILVSIIRNDNNKSIYKSGSIRPGNTKKKAKIQGAKLPEGVYSCTAEITTYEIGTTNKVKSTKEPVTIYIGVKPPEE